MRCVQSNEVAFQNLGTTTSLVHDIKLRLWEAAAPAEATVEDRLRIRMAIMAVLIGNKADSDLGGTTAERSAAAQAVAADLIP